VPPAAREWIAGRRVAPCYVVDGGPYRPHVVIWSDADSGLIVGMDMVLPTTTPAEAADALVRLMAPAPGYVGPSRPRAVRVADPALADALRSRLGEDVRVRVAPTPELDDVLSAMADGMGSDEPEHGYIEMDDTTPATVGRFFEAAQRFYRLLPWKIARDDQVLRLDAPAFALDAAVVSVIGGLGEEFGFTMFGSPADFATFLTLAEDDDPDDGPGVPLFGVTFSRLSTLPPPMRKEGLRHAWPVARKDAWPGIVLLDDDGVRRPLSARDYAVATACLEGLAVLFARHAGVFTDPSHVPVTETVVIDDLPGAPVVTVTAPHPAIEWDEE
jgi:uncharacterized protein DUF6930